MKNYSLIITSDAEHDLKAIRSYFEVNETENTVYILNVIYAKMEQRNVLSKLSDLLFKTDKEN